MFKNKKKKGFTIVELVIVIAVIGILAAILIPTFINLTARANRISNESFVRNINTQLAMDDAENNKHGEVSGALAAAKKIGFHVDDITPYEGNDIIWDEVHDRFAIVKGDFAEAGNQNADHVVFADSTFDPSTPLHKLWKFYPSMPATQSYSIAPKGEWDNIEIADLKVGFDACERITKSVAYVGNGSSLYEVKIRTNGGELKIGSAGNVAKGQIYHYGAVKGAEVYTEDQCFHAHGAIGSMEMKAGKAIADKGALVYLSAATTTITLQENNGGKIFVSPSATQKEDGTGVPVSVAAQIGVTPKEVNPDYTYEEAKKAGGNVYEIGNLAALEQFRDLVNTGFDFGGIGIKMTADITLHDGWKPIGEGARKVGKTAQNETNIQCWFKGTFDGNDHTIYNLNNKGFVPTPSRIAIDDGVETYAYGLFGLVQGEATIKNLKLKNVSIDTTNGDSVAGLVGYAQGALTISGVTVEGSIRGRDSVAGIVGRYQKVTEGNITGCTNNATITATYNGSGKAAGIVGFVSPGMNGEYASVVTVSGNTNNAKITCPLFVAPIVTFGGDPSEGTEKYTFNFQTNTLGSESSLNEEASYKPVDGKTYRLASHGKNFTVND